MTMNQTTVFNPAQMRILHLMSYVKTQKELDDIENIIAQHFANKADVEMDALCESGAITLDTIEEWGNEHMRTPYK